jgi:hypothetical protein
MKRKMLTAFSLLCEVFLILLAWRPLCFIGMFGSVGMVGTAELSLSPSLMTQILELIRDGDKTVTDLMDLGKQLLGRWVYLFSEFLATFLASLHLYP